MTLSNLTPETMALRRKPLMLHLSLAAASLARPHLQSGESFGDDFWQAEKSRPVASDMKKVIEGLAAYQNFPWEREKTTSNIFYRNGELKILHFKARGKTKSRIVIIPSLINGSEILDLLPERSLVNWLSQQGHDVFLIDWGQLRSDQDYNSINDLVHKKMHDAVSKIVSQKTQIPLIGLGYCMGGLLLAAYDVFYTDILNAHIYVATPWNFKTQIEGDLTHIIKNWAREGLSKVACLDYMPMEWLQMIFAGVDPDQIARKYTAFAKMDLNSFDARLFVAVEDWVNGGADVPAGIIHHTVKNWYVDNLPFKGEWKIGRKYIRAEKITKPSLVIVPQRDKIVPQKSAQKLCDLLPNAEKLSPDCGHISMMIGRHAERDVWQPMQEWILRQRNM